MPKASPLHTAFAGNMAEKHSLHFPAPMEAPIHIPVFSGETLSYMQIRGDIEMKIMLGQMLDQKGISQNKLAKDTGISISTLRNLNHNRTTRISFDVLEKLCVYLG